MTKYTQDDRAPGSGPGIYMGNMEIFFRSQIQIEIRCKDDKYLKYKLNNKKFEKLKIELFQADWKSI